jgi:ankyrin repeat protein
VKRIIIVMVALLFVLGCQAKPPTEDSAPSSTFVGAQPLHFAAADDDVESVSLLLDRGAKINATTQDGWTALHFACLHGDIGLVQLLLDRGADVSMINTAGVSALGLATSRGVRDIIELLLDRGASPSL